MISWAGFTARPSTEGQRMHYLILKSCFAGGARRNVGDIVELAVDEANLLMASGRVEKTEAPSPKKEVADRSVSLSGSDAPKVSTRRKKVVKKDAD